MLNIAFCDDDPSILNELRVLLEQYSLERNQNIDYTAFHSPLDLLTEVERGTRFDLLFLDVLMPGENGIDAAAEIRTYDKNVKLIFLTSSSEFAVQSYTVGAYFYQLKPIWRESFFRLMDSVLSTLEKEQNHSLILRCKNGIARIDLAQLEYCEVIHRTLFFHLSSGKVLESIGSMDELCAQLASYGNFLRPHRSYLINLDYVQTLSARAITLSCLTEIPIPRGKYNEIKDTFLELCISKQAGVGMIFWISLLNDTAVSLFGSILSASFCDALRTQKNRWIFWCCIAIIPLMQGWIYSVWDDEFLRKIYPVIVHLPLLLLRKTLFAGDKPLHGVGSL